MQGKAHAITRFLEAALQRYKGFLYLLKLSGLTQFLVPTYDIDLIWHSHQASPLAYREDTTKLFGKVLNHDDTDSDRSKGQKLDTGFNTTRRHWKDTFGTCYERTGAMYRGEQQLTDSPIDKEDAETMKLWVTEPNLMPGIVRGNHKKMVIPPATNIAAAAWSLLGSLHLLISRNGTNLQPAAFEMKGDRGNSVRGFSTT